VFSFHTSPLAPFSFAARLPAVWRLHPQHGSKWILRQACRDLLPESLRQRPKMGFGAPVGDWLDLEMEGKRRGVEFIRTVDPGFFRLEWDP